MRCRPAVGDRTLLHQVWSNLIGNAIKYSSKAVRPLIQISGRAMEAELLYSVRDNGVGFDMQYADKSVRAYSRGCIGPTNSAAPASVSPSCTGW